MNGYKTNKEIANSKNTGKSLPSVQRWVKINVKKRGGGKEQLDSRGPKYNVKHILHRGPAYFASRAGFGPRAGGCPPLN